MMSECACTVYVGVVGWMFDDWKGVVYPRTPSKGFDPLGHLARFIECVELADTSYHPLTPFMAKRWAAKTAGNVDFRFVVRVWRRFTHQREVQWSVADAEVFKRGIEPLATAGKLGALLFQFPINCYFTERDRGWLERLTKEFRDFPRLVEMRHPSWVGAEGLAFLREHGFGFCNVSPSLFLKPSAVGDLVTANHGALRLQGRGGAHESTAEGQGDFMFGPQEITEFAGRVRALSGKAGEFFVMFSNHTRAQSFVNALQLKAALLGRRVVAPAELREAFALGDDVVVDLPPTVR